MRSATEINANKDIELTGNEANLVAYYKFNDGSGQIATDQSSTTNNAVLGSSNTAYTDDPTWVKVNHAITSVSSYRYGFNGMEKDDSIKGEGNSLDFGARIYDPRLGRFLSLDPLQTKYPDISPYHFSGNSPLRFVDFDGKDFGVKINHTSKTIIIVANIYTTSERAYKQAVRAAAKWNNKSTTTGGYTTTFELKVKKPAVVTVEEVITTYGEVDFFKKSGKLKKTLYGRYERGMIRQKAFESASKDDIGNSFAGNNGIKSHPIRGGGNYTAGQTINGKHADMNTHVTEGDQGVVVGLVAHEFGHFFGLDDKDGDDDGHNDTYYPGDGGTMDYVGNDGLGNAITDFDVEMVLKFIKAALAGETTSADSKVILLENKGKSNGDNPIGLKNQ